MILALSSYNYTSALGLSTVKCQQISDTESSGKSDYFFLWLAKDSPMTDVQCKGEFIKKIESFSIDPVLPDGIETRIEADILYLIGTPTKEMEEKEYLLELFGSDKKEIRRFTIKISSNDNYFALQPDKTTEFPKGVSDSIRIGSVGGGKSVVVSFDPALPNGLSYDPQSGTLFGNTDASLGFSIHVISAMITDSEGTRPDWVDGSRFFVNVVPSRITYTYFDYYFPTNQHIEILPETRSATSATYTIENGVVLPAGLIFQSTNGKISGTTPNFEWKSALEIKGTNS